MLYYTYTGDLRGAPSINLGPPPIAEARMFDSGPDWEWAPEGGEIVWYLPKAWVREGDPR